MTVAQAELGKFRDDNPRDAQRVDVVEISRSGRIRLENKLRAQHTPLTHKH
jgi:hypothetical protein